MATTIYAWANPVQSVLGFVDHTWVTSYIFKNGQYPTIKDIPRDGDYWYCWGVYHPSGTGGIHHNPNGAIGSREGNLAIARALVKPNIASPDFPGDDHDPQVGSIFFYAVDGVCHTVANQTLYSTGSSTLEPLQVTQANGYDISSFFYGDYGLNSVVWNDSVRKYAPNVRKPGDYFSKHLASMGFTTEETESIQRTRSVAQKSFTDLHPKVPSLNKYEVYALVGSIILLALEDIKLVIGDENFLKLFPSFSKIPTNRNEATFWIDEVQLEHSMNSIHRIHNKE